MPKPDETIDLVLTPDRPVKFIQKDEDGSISTSLGVTAMANFIYYILFNQIKVTGREDIIRNTALQGKLLAVTAEDPILSLRKDEFSALKKVYDAMVDKGFFSNADLDFVIELDKHFTAK